MEAVVPEGLGLAALGAVIAALIIALTAYLRGFDRAAAAKTAVGAGFGVFAGYLVAMLFGFVIAPGVIIGVVVGLVVVIALQGTRTRVCPHCGAKLPLFRWPKSSRQLLWGGTTCRSCGRAVDYTGASPAA